MKRSFWIIAFIIVVGGFAGFQQHQSCSLNKTDSAANVQQGSERGGGERGQGQGRGGAGQGRAGGRQGGGRDAVPVFVATAVQKTVPVQLKAVGNVEPYNSVSIKSQVTGV